MISVSSVVRMESGFVAPNKVITTMAEPAQPLARLLLTVRKDLLGSFCLLTGSGFEVHARLGCSVKELLCGQLGIDPDYLANRIQTILLNGKAVDDPATAIISPGSTLGLSAAMPGIAGAMLRRGSHYAPMRSPISHDSGVDVSPSNQQGHVLIKLFNMLQQELGPHFCRSGVRVAGRAFGDFLQRRPDAFRMGVIKAEMDGDPLSPDAVLDVKWAGRHVLLTVRA